MQVSKFSRCCANDVSHMIWLDRISRISDLTDLDVAGLSDRERFIVILFYILHFQKLDMTLITAKSEKVFLKLVQNDIGNILSTLEMGYDWIELFYMTMRQKYPASIRLFRDAYYVRSGTYSSTNNNNTPSGSKRTRESFDHDELMSRYNDIVDMFNQQYNLGTFLMEVVDGTTNQDTKDESWNKLQSDVFVLLDRADRSLSQTNMEDITAHFIAIKNCLLEYRTRKL
jgi:hypothetical protein